MDSSGGHREAPTFECDGGCVERLSGRHLSVRPLGDGVVPVRRRLHAHFRHSRERECGKRHDHISNGNVVETRSHEIRGDAQKPGARDIRANPCPARQDGQADRANSITPTISMNVPVDTGRNREAKGLRYRRRLIR